MSSPPVTPGIVSSLLTAEYCSLAAFSLMAYDWIIRFDDEIRCFWDLRNGRKLTAAALVYALSRYPLIIALALSVQTIQPMSDTGCMICEINSYVQSVTSFLSLLTPAVFSALRVYALSGRNKVLAGCTLLLLGVPFGTNAVDFAFYHSVNLPKPFNCSVEDGTMAELELRFVFVLVTRICAIAGDVIVLVVTWWNTYSLYRMERGLLSRGGLASVMLYDGSVYFIAITALNVFQLVFTILDQISTSTLVLSANSYVDIFINPITSVLICHFLLNLRQADRATAGPSSGSLPSAANSLHFAAQPQTASLPAFFASMGELVHAGLDTVEEGPEGEMVHANGLGSFPVGEHGASEAQASASAPARDLNLQDVFPCLERPGRAPVAKLTASH